MPVTRVSSSSVSRSILLPVELLPSNELLDDDVVPFKEPLDDDVSVPLDDNVVVPLDDDVMSSSIGK
jgi:hypothetical protein